MAPAEDPRRAGCFLQFAKAAREGAVKTRLQPRLSAAETVALARDLSAAVACALRAIPAGWDARICTDDAGDAFLQDLARREGRELVPQGAGDLGDRMSRAVAVALQTYRAVIVVGSDCIDYDPEYLAAAVACLGRGRDAVLGPAFDGGYVLVGFSRFAEGVFAGIEWSTDAVCAAQRERFARFGLSWEELPSRGDIDRPEDLWRLGGRWRLPGLRRW